MADDIPLNRIYNHPLVQSLLSENTKQLDLEKIKIPYIMKNKILMSPGTWNNFFYSLESIKEAFNQSDWDSKEVRSLFLDHEDRLSRDWIGEVKNARLNGDTVIGDLIIVDKPTAMKLAYGAKMGISPKVVGQEEDNIMNSFLFNNFSVVINPAVKTAYINNSENEQPIMKKANNIVSVNAKITDFEAERKRKGMSVSDFYAIPRDPPSESKLPIFDAAHVRNAMARFNQVKDVTEDEKSKAKSKIIVAAKRYGIEVGDFANVNNQDKTEVNKMAEEEIKPEAQVEEKVKEEVKAEPAVEAPAEAPVKEAEVIAKVEPVEPVEPVKPVEPEVAVKNSEVSLSDVVALLKELIGECRAVLKQNSSAPKSEEKMEEKKPVPKKEEEPVKKPEEEKPEEKVKEMMDEKDKKIQELSEKLSKTERLLNEPDKVTVKSEELSVNNRTLTVEEIDRGMLRMLQSL